MKTPLISDPLTETKRIHSVLTETFKDFSYILIGDYFSKFMNYFLPDFITKPIYRETVKTADIIFSNVAGPKKSVWYGGGKVELIDYYPFLTTGMGATFLTLISYSNQFKFQLNVNEGIDLDPWEVMEFLEAEFDYTLEKFSTMKENSKKES
eukprot:CAMPEP_0170536492 /NCGR_PEP_ID=MMETSP0209-20121228/102176_1 /TAXON_ID=665100 ORGANISM="Litonotus pictus, Strain P1" /NCGR_SAMPLE_ID=MMETSP0209 /ASSEMBLY_ACC=CAM_ASM_000301 /LENGTH=151 /DNA_ID=CAMNT_0010837861 /DNA_START=1230 /DNA_END=1685 /DNA_ORIENTATION=-